MPIKYARWHGYLRYISAPIGRIFATFASIAPLSLSHFFLARLPSLANIIAARARTKCKNPVSIRQWFISNRMEICNFPIRFPSSAPSLDLLLVLRRIRFVSKAIQVKWKSTASGGRRIGSVE